MQLVEAIKEVLESTPPEVISDIMHRGIVLAGGAPSVVGYEKTTRARIAYPYSFSR